MNCANLTTSTKLEDVIQSCLDGGRKKNALEFAAYLTENQMAPRQYTGPDFWRVPYDSYYLCGIHLQKDSWRFWFFSGDYSGRHDKRFIKAVLDHVAGCSNCEEHCSKGRDMTIFGKEFTNACFQFPIQFVNPGGGTLAYIKQLLEYRKTSAPPGDSLHSYD